MEIFNPLHREVLEKLHHRETHSGNPTGTSINHDYVGIETYRRLFSKLIQPGDTILNIGAGLAVDLTGGLNHLNEEIRSECLKKKAMLVAVDIHHENLLTHQNVKTFTGNELIQSIEADGTKLPFADESVSGITSSNLINCPSEDITLHEQAKGLIREAWRTLKPGGFILLSSFGYIFVTNDSEGPMYNNDLRKKDFLTLKQLEQILLSEGFQNISELEVDEEQYNNISRVLQLKDTEVSEVGGFIAYKPRLKNPVNHLL